MTYADDHAANPCNRCQSPPGVRCEHDEPTPPPAPGLDLDAVERAERAMTPGPWRHGSVERHHVFCSEGDRSLLCPEAGRVLLRMNEHFPHDSDAAGIVALRNAAPALIAEVRAACAKVEALTAELAAARAVTADVCRYLDCAASDLLATVTSLYESRARAISDATDAGLTTAVKSVEAIATDSAAVGYSEDWRAAIDRVLTRLRAARENGGPLTSTCDATAARGTVGGLLAAGEERESRAWSEKGKAPPGSCPFCASRISMVQRDGYFIARCSHRGCGAVGPRMRSVSRAADLFCQPPRREAQGMSCGPIVASPPRPRCSCTHEAGDSRCDAHPSCSECGDSTSRNVDDCADHCQVCASLRRGDVITDWTATCQACKARGPLPKGG